MRLRRSSQIRLNETFLNEMRVVSAGGVSQMDFNFKINEYFGAVVLIVGLLYILNDLALFVMPVNIWHLMVFLLGLAVTLEALMGKKKRR
jgi:hypothetical protein